jgi:hypothetical protein
VLTVGHRTFIHKARHSPSTHVVPGLS